jgi:hypothetical protein
MGNHDSVIVESGVSLGKLGGSDRNLFVNSRVQVSLSNNKDEEQRLS